MTAASFGTLVLDGGTRRYLKQIQRVPILDKEKEYALAKRYQTRRDTDAAHLLIVSHLRLVAKIAARYRRYGFPLADLLSEGTFGLIYAVERFDPDRGFRLATYAIWWIRARIRDFVLRSWSLVRIGTTSAQRKLFFNLRRAKAEFDSIGDNDVSLDAARLIAAKFNVAPAEVVAMNRRLAAKDDSLSAPLRDNDRNSAQDQLVDGSDDQERRLADQQDSSRRRNLVAAGFARLSPREREILTARRLRDRPLSLAELAQRHSVSAERVRQIEHTAFDKLQRHVQEITHAVPQPGRCA